MTIEAPVVDHAWKLQAWLQDVGLQFDPFVHLESASDPHLLQYTVVHEGLARIWEPGDALIFAPVGGGKTALRLYATWHSLRSLYAFFAIPYVLPKHWDAFPPSDFEAHGRALTYATTNAILTILLTFPQRFLTLPDTMQKTLSLLLWRTQPELGWILTQWKEGPWEATLASLLPPALRRGFLPPSQKRLHHVIARIEAHRVSPDASIAWRSLHALFEILHDHFGYRAIHILVDGVDAYSETNRREGEREGARWLARWLTGFREFFRAPIYVKVFAPEMIRPDFRMLEMPWPEAHLQWTSGMLVEMLRRRLYVASQGRFDSLDALAEIELEDLDRRLAHMASPSTPREVLWLVHRLFIEHSRSHNPLDLFGEKDVRRLEERYRHKKSGNDSPSTAAFPDRAAFHWGS